MRLIAVNRLQEGMVLGRDVSTGHLGAVPLLRRGTAVRTSYLNRLADAGIHAVWIDDELGRGIEPMAPLSAEKREAVQTATARAFGEATAAIARGGALPERALREVQDVAARIAIDLAACPTAALALQDLAVADAYTHRHSVQVTIVGILVAAHHFRRHGWTDARGRTRHDRIEERLAALGFGLLVHDIGKLAIPADILNKRGPLTAEEWEVVRQHPLTGVSLLPPSTTSALALEVVRSHHERWDGRGYPDGRSHEGIHPFARIAAVADVYDAVTSERPYRGAAPPWTGVRTVLEGSGTAFDPDVVTSFRAVVMPFPVGYRLDLPDGRVGHVVEVDPAQPDAPVVRISAPGGVTEERVDLREHLRAVAAA